MCYGRRRTGADAPDCPHRRPGPPCKATPDGLPRQGPDGLDMEAMRFINNAVADNNAMQIGRVEEVLLRAPPMVAFTVSPTASGQTGIVQTDQKD